jgi:hypothetical protein
LRTPEAIVAQGNKKCSGWNFGSMRIQCYPTEDALIDAIVKNSRNHNTDGGGHGIPRGQNSQNHYKPKVHVAFFNATNLEYTKVERMQVSGSTPPSASGVCGLSSLRRDGCLLATQNKRSKKFETMEVTGICIPAILTHCFKVSAKSSATESLIALVRDHLDELTLESRDKEWTPLAHLAAISSGRVEEGSGATLLANDRVDPESVGMTVVGGSGSGATTSIAGGSSVFLPLVAACPENVGRQQNNN